MISKAEFEAVLQFEIRARDHYDKILAEVKHPEVRKRIESIRDDEVRHIELARRMLSLLCA